MSITPKVFLHDLAADHKDDIVIRVHDCHPQHITKVGFSCDCNNLVSTSPFTEEPAFEVARPQADFTACNSRYTDGFHSTTLFLSSLRGPPSVS